MFCIVYPDEEVDAGSTDFINIMLLKTPEAFASPTWQQVFDWFEKKHKLVLYTSPYKDHAADVNDDYEWTATVWNHTFVRSIKTRYEANLICVTKALEILEKREIGKRMM